MKVMNVIFKLPWWAYIIIAIFMFFLCLLLNYIVHRINAARIEAKYEQFLRKNPECRAVEAKPSMKMEAPRKASLESRDSNQQPKAISLVFTKDEVKKKFKEVGEVENKVVETVIKKPTPVVSSQKLINAESNPRFLETIYKSIQPANSMDKKEVPEIVEKENNEKEMRKGTHEMVKIVRDSASSPVVKRPKSVHNENLRLCASDDTLTTCSVDIVQCKVEK